MSFPDAISIEPNRTSAARSVPDKGGTARRIRVVFVIDNMRLGGTELNAVRTAEHLDRDRFDLSVVCLGEDGPLTERYTAMGVHVENMPISSFYGPSMLRSGLRFVRMLRRERVDIVHAHDVYSNIFTAVWARVARVPVLITSRRWWNTLPNRKLQIGSRFAAARSTAVLANSAAVARQVADEHPCLDGKVWTITNFVDDHAFDRVDHAERVRIRARWNAGPDAVVIGCVARFDPVKDHVGLVRAFALVHAERPLTRLVLIGDGDMRPTVEELVRDQQLEDAVYFAGEQRSRANLHVGFDISVLASRSEGFPNTLVEAMAAGNAIVATNVGGSGDAVIHEQNGFLVSPGTPDVLAGAILQLVSDSEMRARFGRSGNLRAKDVFSASSVIERLDQMYAHLMGIVA